MGKIGHGGVSRIVESSESVVVIDERSVASTTSPLMRVL